MFRRAAAPGRLSAGPSRPRTHRGSGARRAAAGAGGRRGWCCRRGHRPPRRRVPGRPAGPPLRAVASRRSAETVSALRRLSIRSSSARRPFISRRHRDPDAAVIREQRHRAELKVAVEGAPGPRQVVAVPALGTVEGPVGQPRAVERRAAGGAVAGVGEEAAVDVGDDQLGARRADGPQLAVAEILQPLERLPARERRVGGRRGAAAGGAPFPSTCSTGSSSPDGG